MDPIYSPSSFIGGHDCIGYVGYDEIYDKWREKVVAKLRYGKIYSERYGDVIGRYDSNYWYDLRDHPVALLKTSLIWGCSVEMMSVNYVRDFMELMFHHY